MLAASLYHQYNNYYGFHEDDYQLKFKGPIQTSNGVADHHRDRHGHFPYSGNALRKSLGFIFSLTPDFRHPL
jgi:hypothetical protein